MTYDKYVSHNFDFVVYVAAQNIFKVDSEQNTLMGDFSVYVAVTTKKKGK